jgi:hypothetical protein
MNTTEPRNFSFWSGHGGKQLSVTLFVLYVIQISSILKKWYLLFFLSGRTLLSRIMSAFSK